MGCLFLVLWFFVSLWFFVIEKLDVPAVLVVAFSDGHAVSALDPDGYYGGRE